nr:GAF domain-containing protein [Chloroflexus sp. MS-G]
MFEPRNAETGEAVPVREDQHRDVPSPDRVHTGQKPLARDVQPAAHFLDTLDPRQSRRHHDLFRHVALIRQVRLLCCTRYPTGGDQRGWRMVRLPQTDELTDLRLRGETAVAVRSGHRNQPSFAFPTLQRLDRDTKEFCGFPCAHGVFHEHRYTLSRTRSQARVRLLDTIVDNDEVHFNNALKQLLQSIREQFCAETAAIFWFKEGKLERVLDSGPELPFAESYEPGQGVTGLTLITTSYLRFGRPVRVNNLDEKPEVLQTNVARYRQALPSGKVRHLLAVPINGRRHVIGVIRLVNRLLDPNSHHLDPHGFHSVHEIDLRMIAERLARAIEYRQLTREKEQQLAETQRFYRIYAASTAERNVFETITEEAMAAFPEASKCEIRRLNRSNRTLEYVCARHRRGFDYGSEPIALEGIAGRALREERIQVVPDTSQDADFVAGKVTIGAMMVAPLIGQLGVVGTLSLDYPAPHTFSDEEQRRFTALAMHAALAAEMFWRRMQNEQLRDHIQRINEDISRGVESVYKNVLAALRELIGYDSASIQLRYGNYLKIVAHDGFVDPDALEFISFDIHDQRLPNFYVMRDGMLLIVADVRQDYPHFETEAERYQSKEIRSILYIPMFYRQKIIGMIALDSHVVNFYRFGDGIIGTLLASAAASAIDNARLVEAQERQQESLRRLLKSSTDIIGINDEQELIDSYAQLGIQLFFLRTLCDLYYTRAGSAGSRKI